MSINTWNTHDPPISQIARVLLQGGVIFRVLHTNLLKARKKWLVDKLKAKQPLTDAMRSLVLSGVEEDPDLSEKIQVTALAKTHH